jgi:hypothetical protein
MQLKMLSPFGSSSPFPENNEFWDKKRNSRAENRAGIEINVR